MRQVAHRSSLRAIPYVSALAISALIAVLPAAAAPTASTSFEASSFRSAARALPAAGQLRVTAVPLTVDGKARTADLELQRFEVFAPKAQVVVHTDAGEVQLPIPHNIYLRGRIAGDPRSRVTISVLESGEVHGIVSTDGKVWLMGAAAADSLLQAREANQLDLAAAGGDFRCETASPSQDPHDGAGEALAAFLNPGPVAAAVTAPDGSGFDHTAVIAIETDNEFLALGPIHGNTGLATDYIGDLIAFSSGIYVDEVQTSWSLGHVSLWQTPDPYAQTAACGLLEFGRQWNISNTGITRTTAHFLSGKGGMSGIAWVGVLCRGPFNTSPAQAGASSCAAPVSGTGSYGGAYGFTGGVSGSFNIDSPTVVWDILAFTHEIGHNFNSAHTHCYAGTLGANPIDRCFSGEQGCYSGATSLPAGCPGAGQHCGTIMSYCHLLGGGLGNITMTLGTGHPYGDTPGRVPTVMRTHVVSTALTNPSCLAPIHDDVVFADGFESGNVSRWN